MLHQVNMEALYSATYVENYLDCVENFPNELQRLISRMRELDVYYLGETCFRKHFLDNFHNYSLTARVREVQNQQKNIKECTNNVQKDRMFKRMQQALIAAQELGDEKMSLLQSIHDKIELKTRALDQDFKNLGKFFSIRYYYTKCIFTTNADSLVTSFNSCIIYVKVNVFWGPLNYSLLSLTCLKSKLMVNL